MPYYLISFKFIYETLKHYSMSVTRLSKNTNHSVSFRILTTFPQKTAIFIFRCPSQHSVSMKF